MRVDLQVPFEDKHAARAAGALWDIARRVWYVKNPPSLVPFLRWLSDAHLAPSTVVLAVRDERKRRRAKRKKNQRGKV